MEARGLKKEKKRFEIRNLDALNIQAFDTGNDYPQLLIDLVKASGTAGSCIDRRAKFIGGRGFASPTAYTFITDPQTGETADGLHDKLVADAAKFDAVAIHINYNALGEKISYRHVPVEFCRLCLPDDSGCVSQIAVFDDWTQIKTGKNKKALKKENIDYIDVYNPDPGVAIRQFEEAFLEGKAYKGQILYVNLKGQTNTYTSPIYDEVLTDISTESGCATIRNRGARNGFLPSGMLVVPPPMVTGDEDSSPKKEFEEDFKHFQGAENSHRVFVVFKETGEDEPKFVPFESKNWGDEFKTSEEQAKKNIGSRFMQPAILRGEAVNTGFATDVIQDAYRFYNSVTENERLFFERLYNNLFKGDEVGNDFSILPLRYSESLQNVDKVLEVLKDVNITNTRKVKIIVSLGNDIDIAKELVYDENNPQQ